MREEVNEATSQQVNEFFCLTSLTGLTGLMGNVSKIRNLEDSRNRGIERVRWWWGERVLVVTYRCVGSRFRGRWCRGMRS